MGPYFTNYPPIDDLCAQRGTRKDRIKNRPTGSSGGTTSTGSVARRAFSTESQFIECVSSLVEPQHKEALSKLHTQIGAILRIFNSDRKVNTNELGKLCKGTYLLNLESFPWANITHTLRKLLAHSEELLLKLILALVLNASLKKAQRLVIN